jgi:predicted molibdopterin-dependent oxidoreductase YjgC
VQKLNAATIAPEGAMQDSEIFVRLLDAAGAGIACSTPAEIFNAMATEVPAYRGLNHAAIGPQGIQLGDATGQS